MERGLALQLVMSLGGTKSFRVVTYVGPKATTYKLGTFPTLPGPDFCFICAPYGYDELEILLS
jgi:hypothetical protein